MCIHLLPLLFYKDSFLNILCNKMGKRDVGNIFMLVFLSCIVGLSESNQSAFDDLEALDAV